MTESDQLSGHLFITSNHSQTSKTNNNFGRCPQNYREKGTRKARGENLPVRIRQSMYGANTLNLYVVRGGTTEYQPFEQVIDFLLLKSKLVHSDKLTTCWIRATFASHCVCNFGCCLGLFELAAVRFTHTERTRMWHLVLQLSLNNHRFRSVWTWHNSAEYKRLQGPSMTCFWTVYIEFYREFPFYSKFMLS